MICLFFLVKGLTKQEHDCTQACSFTCRERRLFLKTHHSFDGVNLTSNDVTVAAGQAQSEQFNFHITTLESENCMCSHVSPNI